MCVLLPMLTRLPKIEFDPPVQDTLRSLRAIYVARNHNMFSQTQLTCYKLLRTFCILPRKKGNRYIEV